MIELKPKEMQKFEISIDTSYRKFIVYDLSEVEIIPGYEPGRNTPSSLSITITLTDNAIERNNKKYPKYDTWTKQVMLSNITPFGKAKFRISVAGISISCELETDECVCLDYIYRMSITMKTNLQGSRKSCDEVSDDADNIVKGE